MTAPDAGSPVTFDLGSGVFIFRGLSEVALGFEDVFTHGSVSATLIGNDGANRLRGGAGDDHIEGRGGDDELVGRAGIDLLRWWRRIGSLRGRRDGSELRDLSNRNRPAIQHLASPLETPSPNKLGQSGGGKLRARPRKASQAREHGMRLVEPHIRNLGAVAGVPAKRRPPKPSRVVDQEDELHASGRLTSRLPVAVASATDALWESRVRRKRA